MNNATKCIAVSTPFGFMYLELNGSTYKLSDDSVTIASFEKQKESAGFAAITPINAEWVAVSTGGHWTIASNYGDQFPNG